MSTSNSLLVSGLATEFVGSPQGQVENPLRFPGQYFDAEAALYYNRYRNYDPRLGRYVQSDPISMQGGINQFVYGYANPLVHIDHLGLFADCTWELYDVKNKSDVEVDTKILKGPFYFPMPKGASPAVGPQMPNVRSPISPGANVEMWNHEITQKREIVWQVNKIVKKYVVRCWDDGYCGREGPSRSYLYQKEEEVSRKELSDVTMWWSVPVRRLHDLNL